MLNRFLFASVHYTSLIKLGTRPGETSSHPGL